MVAFLIMEEIVDEKNVSKVHEAIALTSLFNTLVIEWDLQIIKPISVILIEVSPNLSLRVSTWDILDHKICPCLISIQDSNNINRSPIILTLTRGKALLGVLLFQILADKWIIDVLGAVITASTVGADGAMKELMVVDVHSKTTASITRYLFIAVLLGNLGSDLTLEHALAHSSRHTSLATADVREARSKLNAVFIVHLLKIATIGSDWRQSVLRTIHALTPVQLKRVLVLHEGLVLMVFDVGLLWDLLELISHHLKLNPIAVFLKHGLELQSLMIVPK